MMELSKEYLAMKAAAKLTKPIKTTIGEFADRDPKQGAAIDHSIATGAPLFASSQSKTLKSVTIEAEFGELKGGRTYQVGRGKGSNFKAAAAAAIRDLLKQKGLKAQRFTTCKAAISFGTITEG